jgi:hypothetical protein
MFQKSHAWFSIFLTRRQSYWDLSAYCSMNAEKCSAPPEFISSAMCTLTQSDLPCSPKATSAGQAT